ncbi:hypothetical protein M9458_054372 [Cirrhinus mrigala]|uniref:Uncharacterized protein n=1 Tax=Cirrhinus mrigala TaxID=683832 RepID=A0ABD0MMV1_CIRMR
MEFLSPILTFNMLFAEKRNRPIVTVVPTKSSLPVHGSGSPPEIFGSDYPATNSVPGRWCTKRRGRPRRGSDLESPSFDHWRRGGLSGPRDP